MFFEELGLIWITMKFLKYANTTFIRFSNKYSTFEYITHYTLYNVVN